MTDQFDNEVWEASRKERLKRMSKNPIEVLDSTLDPMLQLLNQMRQAKDALPPFAWGLIPVTIRAPMDQVFGYVETFDRQIGLLRAAGIIGPKEV